MSTLAQCDKKSASLFQYVFYTAFFLHVHTLTEQHRSILFCFDIYLLFSSNSAAIQHVHSDGTTSINALLYNISYI